MTANVPLRPCHTGKGAVYALKVACISPIAVNIVFRLNALVMQSVTTSHDVSGAERPHGKPSVRVWESSPSVKMRSTSDACNRRPLEQPEPVEYASATFDTLRDGTLPSKKVSTICSISELCCDTTERTADLTELRRPPASSPPVVLPLTLRQEFETVPVNLKLPKMPMLALKLSWNAAVIAVKDWRWRPNERRRRPATVEVTKSARTCRYFSRFESLSGLVKQY